MPGKCVFFCFNTSYDVASDTSSSDLRACEIPSESKALMEPSGLGARPNTMTIVVVRSKRSITAHILRKMIADYHGRVLTLGGAWVSSAIVCIFQQNNYFKLT